MKRGLVILLLALAGGAGGFFWMRQHQQTEAKAWLADCWRHGEDGHHPELDWLRAELGVPEDSMSAVMEVHNAYHPVCRDLTRRIETSHARLAALTRQGKMSAELEAALREHADIHLDCQRAMLKHFYATAACLPPDLAQRYLEKMVPYAFIHDSADSGDHEH